MKLYFALSKTLYKHPISSKAVDEIYKYFNINNIKIESFFNSATDFEKLDIKIPSSLISENEKEKFIQNSCIEKSLRYCDSLVYMNTFTQTGNVSFTNGVKAEVNYALKNNMRIFQIYLTNTGNVDTSEIKEIKEMSTYNIKNSVEELYKKHTPENQEWTLKTINDYLKLYKTQPEMLEYLHEQCYNNELSKIGVHGIVNHKSFIYETNITNKIPYFSCHDHYIYKHSYANPKSQILVTECPYFRSNKLFHNKIYERIPKFPDEIENMINIIIRNRIIHKLMYIFDPLVHNRGVCLRNEETGYPIISKEGKYIPDPKLIKGVQILIDLDIKKQSKDEGLNFFTPTIYNEYVKSLRLLLPSMLGENYNTKDVKIMLSGNGLYIILRKYINFKEYNVQNYHKHELTWEILRENYENVLKNNNIKHLQIEKGYGWNRYFKLAGTLHASKERVSIPLNVESMINNPDYIKYIDENSKIQNLLDNKVKFIDILNNSEW